MTLQCLLLIEDDVVDDEDAVKEMIASGKLTGHRNALLANGNKFVNLAKPDVNFSGEQQRAADYHMDLYILSTNVGSEVPPVGTTYTVCRIRPCPQLTRTLAPNSMYNSRCTQEFYRHW